MSWWLMSPLTLTVSQASRAGIFAHKNIITIIKNIWQKWWPMSYKIPPQSCSWLIGGRHFFPRWGLVLWFGHSRFPRLLLLLTFQSLQNAVPSLVFSLIMKGFKYELDAEKSFCTDMKTAAPQGHRCPDARIKSLIPNPWQHIAEQAQPPS